jgi:hypothetical protein
MEHQFMLSSLSSYLLRCRMTRALREPLSMVEKEPGRVKLRVLFTKCRKQKKTEKDRMYISSSSNNALLNLQ